MTSSVERPLQAGRVVFVTLTEDPGTHTPSLPMCVVSPSLSLSSVVSRQIARMLSGMGYRGLVQLGKPGKIRARFSVRSTWVDGVVFVLEHTELLPTHNPP